MTAPWRPSQTQESAWLHRTACPMISALSYRQGRRSTRNRGPEKTLQGAGERFSGVSMLSATLQIALQTEISHQPLSEHPCLRHFCGYRGAFQQLAEARAVRTATQAPEACFRGFSTKDGTRLREKASRLPSGRRPQKDSDGTTQTRFPASSCLRFRGCGTIPPGRDGRCLWEER
jgi:hypothetical protein